MKIIKGMIATKSTDRFQVVLQHHTQQSGDGSKSKPLQHTRHWAVCRDGDDRAHDWLCNDWECADDFDSKRNLLNATMEGQIKVNFVNLAI